MFGKKKKVIEKIEEDPVETPVIETNQKKESKMDKEKEERLARVFSYWANNYGQMLDPNSFAGDAVIANLLMAQLYELKLLRESIDKLVFIAENEE